jgi:hypothetical protein
LRQSEEIREEKTTGIADFKKDTTTSFFLAATACAFSGLEDWN